MTVRTLMKNLQLQEKLTKKEKKIAPSLSNASQMCVVRMLVNYNCTHTVRVKIALVSKVLRK